MERSAPKGPICQSCSMPMQQAADFGTNGDGGRSQEYCRYCFQKGQFTAPDMTLAQMTDKLAGMAARMNMTEPQARALAQKVLPQLKRWRKG